MINCHHIWVPKKARDGEDGGNGGGGGSPVKRGAVERKVKERDDLCRLRNNHPGPRNGMRKSCYGLLLMARVERNFHSLFIVQRTRNYHYYCYKGIWFQFLVPTTFCPFFVSPLFLKVWHLGFSFKTNFWLFHHQEIVNDGRVWFFLTLGCTIFRVVFVKLRSLFIYVYLQLSHFWIFLNLVHGGSVKSQRIFEEGRETVCLGNWF